MYPRSYSREQYNSYLYSPQNIPGVFHYPNGYPQPRAIDYSIALPTEPRPLEPVYPAPPRLTHISEQRNDYYFTTPVEERPSCMLQESWRPGLSRTTNEHEEYSEENDGDSLEDGVEGKKSQRLSVTWLRFRGSQFLDLFATAKVTTLLSNLVQQRSSGYIMSFVWFL